MNTVNVNRSTQSVQPSRLAWEEPSVAFERPLMAGSAGWPRAAWFTIRTAWSLLHRLETPRPLLVYKSFSRSGAFSKRVFQCKGVFCQNSGHLVGVLVMESSRFA